VVENADGSVVVTVRGNLDIDSAAVLTATLDQVLDRPEPRVVVDLSEVEFCDSMGLSAFVVGNNRAVANGGWVRLAGPGEFLRELFETLGLTRWLDIYASVPEALTARRDG
jgi:anti-anti-sigma factor